jgi:hypothetical protein
LRQYKKEGDNSSDFTSFALSPQQKYLYAVNERGLMFVFNVQTGAVESEVEICKKELIGMAHHPAYNILISYDDAGQVKFWK